jgi:nicotinate dehydrogenase subunit A
VRVTETLRLNVNGQIVTVATAATTPLLYVLRNDCRLNGPRFGCGLGQCGACTVLADGAPIRSCIVPARSLSHAKIVTLEGLGTVARPHRLQRAFIRHQAAQCGYCINGMIMTAKALLDSNPHPTEADIKAALAANLCRCGTHLRIVRAVQSAAADTDKSE